MSFNIGESLQAVCLDLENLIDLRKVHDIEAYHQENTETEKSSGAAIKTCYYPLPYTSNKLHDKGLS